MRAPGRVTLDGSRARAHVRVSGSDTPVWPYVAGPVVFGLFGAMFGGFTGSATVALALGGIGAVGGYLFARDAYPPGA